MYVFRGGGGSVILYSFIIKDEKITNFGYYNLINYDNLVSAYYYRSTCVVYLNL